MLFLLSFRSWPAVLAVLLLSLSCHVPVPVVSRGLLAGHSNIAVYWGEEELDLPLRAVCADPAYSVINVAFVYNIGGPYNPTLSLDNGQCTDPPIGAAQLNCTTVGQAITDCQRKYGKTVMLTLGGADGMYGFYSAQDAIERAGQMWRWYLGGQPSAEEPPRPFGSAVFDGLDLDLEGQQGISGWQVSRGPNITYWINFTDTVRALGASSGRYVYFSGAPQCPFQDETMGPDSNFTAVPTVLSHSFFDWLNIQYYNNAPICGVSVPSTFHDNFLTWVAGVASPSSPNPSLRLLIGLLGSGAAGGGYVNVSTLQSVVAGIASHSAFAGCMVWEEGEINGTGNVYQTQLKKMLDSLNSSSVATD